MLLCVRLQLRGKAAELGSAPVGCGASACAGRWRLERLPVIGDIRKGWAL